MRSSIKISVIATVALIGVLVSAALSSQWAGAVPLCPSSWPAQAYDGPLQETDYGRIGYEDLYTDSDGDRWFVIRSADSNGYTTVRAYQAHDDKDGYIAGAPDEVCYLLVRRPGDAVDAAEPKQITFAREKAESPRPPATPKATAGDPFARWNDLEPQPWWRDSEPYSCLNPAKETSPWIEAGMTDLGGSDPLSLIRFYGNGSYLRYGFMGFEGCTPIKKYPGRTHLDPPVDPAYYSLGDLDIAVDIARVPPDAPGWFQDDRARETMTMAEAVNILNTHVAAYFEKISEGKLRMRFQAGNDFALEGDGSPNDVRGQQLRLAGVMNCRGKAPDRYPCDQGDPGGLNRLLLTDVTTDRGGDAFNGSVRMGLVSLREANLETLAHEMGHAWMSWPHSHGEVRWDEEEGGLPNPYANALDFMSGLALSPTLGWHQDMPSTLAVNRYAAGWIDPSEVALHLSDSGTYTLQPPRERGYQMLVISSGRTYAFTTVEVLDERNPAYVDQTPKVYDPSSPEERRQFRYHGVLVSRYDQSTGTGINARFGPALYDERNPDISSDVNWGRDDFSVVQDGEARDIGGGLRLQVSRNADGSYEVSVSGGRTAEFKPWCNTIWFDFGEYDTDCALDDGG